MSDLLEQKKVKLTYPSVGHGAPGQGKRDYTRNTQWFIQEKIDGSQFTTIVTSDGLEFYCRSKRIGAGACVFNKAMEMMNSIKDRLNVGYAYHGECVQSLKQNTIVYERTPAYFNIIYDIQDQNGKFLSHSACAVECERVGLEYVGEITTSRCTDPHAIATRLVQMMDSGEWKCGSILGRNTTPEGVVLKCHDFAVGDKSSNTKLKFVRKEFKEMNQSKKPKAQTRSPSQYCKWVGLLFNNQARIDKAYQHLKMACDSKLYTLEGVDQELDRDLLKERSRLIYKYLAVEFVPIVRSNERKRKEYDQKWVDDPVYNALININPQLVEIEDHIYACCLLEVLKYSRG